MDAGPFPCEDADQDGFWACEDENHIGAEIDCDDQRWFIQPGGYEHPDNGFDDDCDGFTDEIEICGCEEAGGTRVDGVAMANAFDLCGGVVNDAMTTGEALQFFVLADF